VVELELLQRGESAIALLGEGQAALLELPTGFEAVVSRRGLAQERARDREDGRRRDEAAEHERNSRHATAASGA
jgi:hypothetical protein